jgi:hypothetical protein
MIHSAFESTFILNGYFPPDETDAALFIEFSRTMESFKIKEEKMSLADEK